MITQKNTLHKNLLLTSVVISIALSGCATLIKPDPNDEWQSWNRSAQSFNDDFDKNILKPVAKGYVNVTPGPIDDGVTNFFSNMNDIGVTVNDLLQLKFLQSGMDFSRFVINSTVGIAGIFDVAKLLDLPKHHEDFGQTLGYWGVPAGPYLVLPLFGPSSPRDTVGMIGDALLDPLTYVAVFGGVVGNVSTIGASALDVTDERAGLMSTEKMVNEAAVDRYEFIKNAYQQHREYLVHDGNPPVNDVDSEDTENADTSSNTQQLNNTAKTNSSTNVTAPAKKPMIPNGINTAPVPNKASPISSSNGENKHLLKLSAPEEKLPVPDYKKEYGVKSGTDLRACLKLPTNDAIAKCTAKNK